MVLFRVIIHIFRVYFSPNFIAILIIRSISNTWPYIKTEFVLQTAYSSHKSRRAYYINNNILIGKLLLKEQ
jgi:hypothetical protein